MQTIPYILVINHLKMNINKELQGVSGIYQIIVKSRKKLYTYIGSSKDIYYRLHGHLSDLKKGKHGNIILQRLFDKYGIDCISYTILESGVQTQDLAHREQYWIDQQNPLINIKKDVVRNLPNKISNQKISNTLKKKWNLGQIEHTGTAMFPVYMYDMDGNFVKEFRSLSQASLELFGHTNQSHKIQRVCKGERKSVGGYQFTDAKQEFLPKLATTTSNKTRSKHFDIKLSIVETGENIEIVGGVHGLYKYLANNLYKNPNLSYNIKLAPVKSEELLESTKAISTTTELETTDVKVEKLIDDYNGKSAA